MENGKIPKLKPSPSSSSSFKLRSPSLNALRLQRIFDVFDSNGDGVITVDELGKALSRLGLDAQSSDDLKSTVDSYIQPGNDGLRFEDFEKLHKDLDDKIFGGTDSADPDDEADEEDMREAFKVFDENGDGYISVMELQTVLEKLGLPEGREISRVEKMIGSVDRNNDGRVDFLEFKNMMRSVIVPNT